MMGTRRIIFFNFQFLNFQNTRNSRRIPNQKKIFGFKYFAIFKDLITQEISELLLWSYPKEFVKMAEKHSN
jgi:hypothetical protein